MITIRKENTGLFITFDLSWVIVDIIKGFPNRKFNKHKGEWELPIHYFNILCEQFDTNKLKYKIIDNVKVVKNNKDYVFKTEPRSYQLDSFEYAQSNFSWFLGDEQGLGKTKQVLDISCSKKNVYNYDHCLIVVCLKNLRLNWANEIKIHTNEDFNVLGGCQKNLSSKKVLQSIKNIPSEYFWIINIESLRNREISNLLRKYVRKGIISMVVVDEIHRTKLPTTQQAKGLLKLSDAQEKIVITGTPIVNSPLDGFIILKFLGHEKTCWTNFKNYFCELGGYGGYQIIGYRNMLEYYQKFKNIMLRRLKKDVLDLPEKITKTEYLEMSAKQLNIYNEALISIKSQIDKIKLQKNPLTKLLRLRQATGHTALLSSEVSESIKFERVLELIEDNVQNGEKTVIFSQFRSIIELLEIKLHKYKPAVITGEVKEECERHRRIEYFSNNDECKVILGTTQALGVGFTLTAASQMIFIDSPWSRANKDQASDRIHRIGTKSNVTITTLVCKDTIDEKIEQLIEKKGEMSDYLIDGKIIGNREKLLDWLIY